VLISCPLRLADSEHSPEGELPHRKNGQVPLIHPDVCQRPVGAAKLGPLVSRTYSENVCKANVAGWVQVAFPQTSCIPK